MNAWPIALLKNDSSPWVDDGRISAVSQAVPVGPDTIDTDHVALIFNSSGLQKDFPVLGTSLRPVGDEYGHIVLVFHISRPGRKTKIVTDKRPDPPAV